MVLSAEDVCVVVGKPPPRKSWGGVWEIGTITLWCYSMVYGGGGDYFGKPMMHVLLVVVVVNKSLAHTYSPLTCTGVVVYS